MGLFALLLNLNAFEDPIKINQNLLIPKSQEAIYMLADELKKKANIELAIFAISDSNNSEYQKVVDEYIQKSENSSYFLVLFVLDTKKIDLKVSDDLKESVDKKEIYWDYMVPLLPKKADEINTEIISAIVLNGVIGFATQVSDIKNIKIDILQEMTKGDTTAAIVKYLFYLMILSLVVLFIYRVKKG